MSPSVILRVLLLIIFFFSIKLKADEDISRIPPVHCPPPTTCKNIKISHPFWRLDNYDGPVCGYPGLGIDCSNPDPEYPLLNIYGEYFLVKNISYTDHSITLVDFNYMNTAQESCPALPQNLTINETSPLVYNDAIDLKLTFYLNCASDDDLHYPGVYPIACFSTDEKTSYLNVGLADPYILERFKTCGETVVTAVKEEDEFRRPEWTWNISFIRKAMNKGFVLNWQTVEGCGRCEDSGGRCGRQDKYSGEALCFCNNGTVFHDQCPSKPRGLSVGWKVAIGIGAAAIFAIVIGAFWFVCQRRHKNRYTSSYFMSRSTPSDPSSSTMDLEKAGHYHGVPLFDYSELVQATDNFDSKNELGEGGFGTVYRGKLKDGRVVAVKRLYENNYKRVEQFMNEIEILQGLCHRNLVRLYGCTSRHCRELLLVYEYIPNGTIADHLHGEGADPRVLSWSTRLSIAVETASALTYLHASEVIHRDVKTNNILLGDNFCVKVADFGLSRLFPTQFTHVSTAPQGTPGYLDPEYHECYQLTSKSDVYSFGVVLIELISSLPAVDITRHRHEINLSNMAINKIQCNALHELVDKSLGFESDDRTKETISAVAELAFQCLQSGRDMRPSMQEVLESLLEIQSLDLSTEKKDSVGSPTDAPLLLKKNNNEVPSHSPNSVINVQWPSGSTTHSSSSY